MYKFLMYKISHKKNITRNKTKDIVLLKMCIQKDINQIKSNFKFALYTSKKSKI